MLTSAKLRGLGGLGVKQCFVMNDAGEWLN